MKTYTAEDGTELHEFRSSTCYVDAKNLAPPHMRCHLSEYVDDGRVKCLREEMQVNCMRSSRPDNQSVIFVTKPQLALLTMLYGDET